MSRIFHVLLIAALCMPGRSHASDDCTLWMLKQLTTSVGLESVKIGNGQTEVVMAGSDGAISPVIATATGQSGSMVAPSDNMRIIGQCRDGILLVLASRDGQPAKEVMSQPMKTLASWQLRLHVIGSDGVRQRLKLDRWAHASAEQGPVIDLFQGKLPIPPGGYIITTVIEDAEASATLEGHADASLRSGHLFTELAIGSYRLRAVIDTAAATTLVRAGALSADVAVGQATMRRQSAEGTAHVPVVVQGAGGAVGRIGMVTLHDARLGTITLDEIQALVSDSMPVLEGGPIDAIIGLDILQQAGVVHFGKVPASEGSWRVSFGPHDLPQGQPAWLVDLHAAGNLYAVQAQAGINSIWLVLDSGAPTTFLSPAAAAHAAALFDSGPDAMRTVRGLDGKLLESYSARIASLTLGDLALSNVAVRVASLPVLAKIDHPNVGVLGSDLLFDHDDIELDFTQRQLRIWH